MTLGGSSSTKIVLCTRAKKADCLSPSEDCTHLVPSAATGVIASTPKTAVTLQATMHYQVPSAPLRDLTQRESPRFSRRRMRASRDTSRVVRRESRVVSHNVIIAGIDTGIMRHGLDNVNDSEVSAPLGPRSASRNVQFRMLKFPVCEECQNGAIAIGCTWWRQHH